MIKIKNEMKLDNGATATYFVVGMISVFSDKISIILDGFVNREYFEKAMQKNELLAKQSKMIEEFNEMQRAETMTEEIRQNLCDLQAKVNQNADLIQSLDNYSDLVIISKEYDIATSNKLTEEELEKHVISELNKIEDFKNATLDKDGE